MTDTHRLDHEPYLVPPGKKIRLKAYDPDFTAGFKDKRAAEDALLEDVSSLAAAQDVLWASKEYSIIIIFQALDAAGKDGTIKHVMSGVNPQGVIVHSFKAPSEEERMRHFLWRPARVLPACGTIAIFNRSYYEEVLVVRVHPEFLEKQWLPREQREKGLDHFWQTRYDEIKEFETALSGRNVLLLKFFLNVSKEEQHKRFLQRLENSEKNWKFSVDDVRERSFWADYQRAYEEMLSATSTELAPWYIIPADKKWFTRACVADIIAHRIQKLDLKYPKLSEKALAALADARRILESENR
jgi:PPK2 family polyphosphate:nucleotide phosphotransferase